MAMKPRERVILALDHKEPDRIPIDLGGSICSSIHKNAYAELKEYLGMELEELKMAESRPLFRLRTLWPRMKPPSSTERTDKNEAENDRHMGRWQNRAWVCGRSFPRGWIWHRVGG